MVIVNDLPLKEFYLNSYGWFETPERYSSFLSEELIKFVPILKDILQQIYPDRWDIRLTPFRQTEYQLSYALFPVIYFPELLISNGNKQHKVTDVYAGILLYAEEGNIITPDALYSFRSSATLEEVKASYVLSHSSANYMNDFLYHMCLGEGEIRKSFSLFSSTQDIMVLRHILLQIETVLSWESIDGGPYRKISEISWGKTLPTDGSYNNKYVDPIFQYILKDLEKEIPLILSNQTLIVDEESPIYEEYLKRVILKVCDDVKFCLVGERNGKPFLPYLNEDETEPPPGISIPFRGKVIDFELKSSKKRKEITLHVDQNLKQNVTRKITQYLQERILQRSINKRLKDSSVY